MIPNPTQLSERWETDDGKKRLSEILKAVRQGRPWEKHLKGFPWVDHVAGGKDLRYVEFENLDATSLNLEGADLTSAKFKKCNLLSANFSDSNAANTTFWKCGLRCAAFRGAKMRDSDFTLSDLTGAYFDEADLSGSCFAGCWLRDAYFLNTTIERTDFTAADLTGAWLNFANLRGSSLEQTRIVRACLRGADISGCYVYGVSAWDVCLDNTIQRDLIVSGDSSVSKLTVDNLDVAQFVHLLIHNPRIRGVIDEITSKVVLILGRFTPTRKALLDGIREELRRHNYSPVLFDFEAPSHRDLTETIAILSHLARFVIADITDAKCIPQELMAIVPNLPSVPVQPLLLKGQIEYSMLEHFYRYPWFLPVYEYENEDSLLNFLGRDVIEPAEAKALELRPHHGEKR